MRVAHIIPARDKAANVAATVHSVLNQTYPCHVVLSDQGSTDGTLSILRYIALSYRGPHKVSVLSCPETEPKGMRGMNAHLDWIMGRIDEDVILITSADDLAMPERNAKVMKAFEEHKPDMVLTGLLFSEPDGKCYGQTAHPSEDGFVKPTECLRGLVGGGTAHAWTRDFYEAVGGFSNGYASLCGFDAYWPFLATVRNGAWFIYEPLHIHVRHVDPNNTGLEGVHRAAGSDEEKLAVEELMHFQVMTAYVEAGHVMERWGCENEEAKLTLFNEILCRGVNWSKARAQMTVKSIQPRKLKA